MRHKRRVHARQIRIAYTTLKDDREQRGQNDMVPTSDDAEAVKDLSYCLCQFVLRY